VWRFCCVERIPSRFFLLADGSDLWLALALATLCSHAFLARPPTQNRYVGHWKGNKKDGEGTFWFSDGNIYTGLWRNDVKHGLGKLRYRPGTLVEESYEGEFDRGLRHGHGIYR
jgi:hypothetical protein